MLTIRDQGGHLVFSICPKDTNAVADVSLHSLHRFKRGLKCLDQSETRAAILFSDRPEKHKLGRGR